MRCRFHLHSAEPGKLLKRLCLRGSAAFCYREQAFHLLHAKDAIPASLDCGAHAMKQIRGNCFKSTQVDLRPVMIYVYYFAGDYRLVQNRSSSLINLEPKLAADPQNSPRPILPASGFFFEDRA